MSGPEVDLPEFKLPILNETIKSILPHRYPFLLVDRVVELDRGKRILAYKNVTANEEYFNGHFPHHAVMPGVLQLEALAQAARFYLLVHAGRQHQDCLFDEHGKREISTIVVPGDKLELQVEVLKLKRGLCKVSAQATVDGERASEAVITAAIRDRE